MNTLRLPLILLASALTGRALCADTPLVLADQGVPRAVIVIPAGRNWQAESWTVQSEQHAAACLQGNLAQISGTLLPIIDEKALGPVAVTNGLLVPATNQTNASAFILVGEGRLARELGVTHEGLQPGGYRIRTVGNALVLLGHPTLSHPLEDGGGVRRAVAVFLESLGCRYLWPGELGKVMPALPTLAVDPIDRSFNPPLPQRRIRSWFPTPKGSEGLAALGLDPTQTITGMRMAEQTRAGELGRRTAMVKNTDFTWLQWQGLGGVIDIGGGHAFGDAWEKWGAAHPEWFAQQGDGSREQSQAGSREQLCTTAPGLADALADEILTEAATNKSLCYSICPNDGGYSSFCLCEACRKLDPPNAPLVPFTIFDHAGQSKRHETNGPSLSDRYVVFWNAIADRVAEKRPDLVLLTQAYSVYSTPPVREKLRPNLALRYVPADTNGWAGWQQAGASKIYWRPNLFHNGGRTGELRQTPRTIADTIRFLARNGMMATDIDSLLGHWSTHGLSYYTTARMNWDPSLTADAILDDYCRSGFGPAAQPVRRYFELAEELQSVSSPSNAPSPESIVRLRACLADADRAAGTNEVIRARINFLRRGLNHTDLTQSLYRLASEAKAGRPVDKAQARRLLECYALAMRDGAMKEPLALNAAWIQYRGGAYASWDPIGGRTVRPSVELFSRIDEAGLRLTGRENSLDDLLAAFHLDEPGAPAGKPAPGQPAGKTTHEPDADENGRVLDP